MKPSVPAVKKVEKVSVPGVPTVTGTVALMILALTPSSGEIGDDPRWTWKAFEPVFPGEMIEGVAAGSGTWTVHEARSHSKSPLGMRPREGQGVGVGVQVGPQAQAEMYLAGAVPQAEVARVG